MHPQLQVILDWLTDRSIEIPYLVRHGSIEALQEMIADDNPRRITDPTFVALATEEIERKDRPSYSRTYRIVTEESAEDGDCAEHGFILPDGDDHPCPTDPKEIEAWRAVETDTVIEPFEEDDLYPWMPENTDPIMARAWQILQDLDCTERVSDNVWENSGHTDYWTDQHRQEDACFHNVTPQWCDDLEKLHKLYVQWRRKQRF